ncbi:hypothetical protein COBT_001953 [Conglomerata obtusa]
MNKKLRQFLIYLFVSLLCVLVIAWVFTIIFREKIPKELKKYFCIGKEELKAAVKIFEKDKEQINERIIKNNVLNCDCKYFLSVTKFFFFECDCKKILYKSPVKPIDKWIQLIYVKIINSTDYFDAKPYEDAMIKYLKNGEKNVDDATLDKRFNKKLRTFEKSFLERSLIHFLRFAAF